MVPKLDYSNPLCSEYILEHSLAQYPIIVDLNSVRLRSSFSEGL
jgi:hypothetical protein